MLSQLPVISQRLVISNAVRDRSLSADVQIEPNPLDEEVI